MNRSIRQTIRQIFLVLPIPLAFAAGASHAAESAPSFEPDWAMVAGETQVAQRPNRETPTRQWYDGFSLEIRGGAALLEDAELEGQAPFNNDLDFDEGFSVGGEIGYSLSKHDLGVDLLRNMRIGLEVSYASNDNDTLSGSGAFTDETSALAGMFNLYYDQDTGTPWKPYIGAGVGVANIDFEGQTLGGQRVDDDDTVFAYQARAGIGYELSSTAVVSLGYRFFDTLDPEFDAQNGTSFDSEYRSHTVEVGLRYKF